MCLTLTPFSCASRSLDSWTNTPTITAASSTPPAYDQDAFRARNDNGNETTATWKVAANTNWDQDVDQNFRVRFVIQETNGASVADKTFQLEYNRNGGGWNDVDRCFVGGARLGSRPM